MEIKTKYQYTYFIYPYVIEEEKYEKYINRLLLNKNCELKLFEKEKDEDLYTYFLPQIRNYMFGSFDYNMAKKNKLNEFDSNMKSVLLAKGPCTVFEYKIEKDIQGKAGRRGGIFFNIRNIKIICFSTGICFLLIKTTLDEGSTIEDICNFNYKFRDINSSIDKLKEFENIKIQTDSFDDIKRISTLIKEITGSNVHTKELNINTERFFTYSYACIGQEYWEESNEEILEKEFQKFVRVESSKVVVDKDKIVDAKLQAGKHIKYGSTSISSALLTSDISTDNYTKLPHEYERQYLYNYIYELYKKVYLKKINKEFSTSNKFEEAKEKFLNFTQNIWVEETTNNELGINLSEDWNLMLKTQRLYSEVKRKYDIMYKNKNIEKTAKSNKWIVIVLIILVIINIINCIKMFK